MEYKYLCINAILCSYALSLFGLAGPLDPFPTALQQHIPILEASG